MKKESNVYKLSTTDFKILETISLLNEEGIYPLPEGVFKILKGDESEEIEPYRSLKTYKTLVSYSSKKVSRYIIMLLRYRYLEKIYDRESDELYLKVAPVGIVELEKYHKKHKYNFKKKKVKSKPLFLKIEKNWKFIKFQFFYL